MTSTTSIGRQDAPTQSDGEQSRAPRGSVSLGQWVHEQLCELIIDGTFAPSAPLRESKIADMLGTSRVPVREALQRLADDGWVDRVPRVGARVRVPRSEDIDEIFSLRRVLEMEAVRMAVRHISLADADRLRELVAAGFAAYASQDIHAIIATNTAFHRDIAVLSGSVLLCQMLDMLDRRVRWLFGTIAIHRGDEAVQEHLDLVEAMLQRDVDRAVNIIDEHVRHTAEYAIDRWRQTAGAGN